PSPPRRLNQPFLSGTGNILRLLSNPAGEMVPLYQQLTHRQLTLVGYGLAVLANLCFVTGGMQHLATDSWLMASQLWAAGGLTFVAMVLSVASARVWLSIRGLWVADIFILGSALVPLGVLFILTALIQAANTSSAPLLILLAILWAFSHTLITLYSGFARIQAFPDRIAAWLTPVVLAIGIAAGVGTWRYLSGL
ncbi:MAG: hypothetical protein WA885_08995, partial [Phormidesmis sp.]